MDIQRLRTLRELAIRGTMAAVADAVGLSPSAVSQQVSLLERELDATLVERRGRGVVLTAAGQRLVEHAERLLTVIEEARTDLAEIERSVAGELTVASFPSIAAGLLAPAIKSLQDEYPRLTVSAIEMEPKVGLAALRSWQCDVAIIDNLTLQADDDPGSLDISALYEDRIVAVLHRSHPLARKKSLELSDLKDENWAMDTRPNTFSEIIFEMCRARGYEPRIIGRFDAFDVISAMVAHQCAISVLPQIRTLLIGRDLVSRQFKPAIRRTILLATRRGELRRPALRVTVEAMKHHAGMIPVLTGNVA